MSISLRRLSDASNYLLNSVMYLSYLTIISSDFSTLRNRLNVVYPKTKVNRDNIEIIIIVVVVIL